MISQTVSTLSVFRNEALSDFSLAENKSAMIAAIKSVQSQLGQEKYPLVIAGRAVNTEAEIVSRNPAHPNQVVARHAHAGPEMVPAAVEAAIQAFPGWSAQSVEDRADLLLRAAAAIRSRKMEFSAWLVVEVGKNWAEADADTAETIDFLEFYAREALRLASVETPIQYPGEKNELVYLPLGVGVVIPPWNFPLAIMAGMTAAAIVTGNTVVLKPSPLAPTIASHFMALLQECGLPPGVVNLCQGGAEFGSALVQHPQIRFIAFTGSKKVGLDIHLKAANVVPGQHWIKRTVLELGGKDAIIVEADADLKLAADGVVASAFGFNGQKCSACSRVIVNETVHDSFVQLLKERISNLSQGDPASNHATGPVASEESYHRILGYLEEAKQQGNFVTGGSAFTAPDQGYYIAPTLITGLPRDARICQEEIFGPVLAVIASRDFDDALEIANNTEYGLTGSVYSSSEEKLALAYDRFHVGNLYFNRKCTGAMVGAHPFGGFNMSGTDSKAGGADYLLLFTQAKSVARRCA
jgi:1-pyrroline-5-carboxylate dehydrogenase